MVKRKAILQEGALTKLEREIKDDLSGNAVIDGAEETTDKRGAEFIKFGENQENLHGFGKSITVAGRDSINAKELSDEDVVIALRDITFISMEFLCKDIEKKVKKAYKDVKSVLFFDNEIFAEIGLAKKEEIGLGVLDDVYRSLDELLNPENIPNELAHLVNYVGDPVRVKNGKTYVTLDTHKVIGEFILVDLVHFKDLTDNGRKLSGSAKEKLVQDITKQFMDCILVSDIVVSKGRLNVAFEPECDEDELFMEFNTANLVVLNASMTHERFTSLCAERFAKIRKGTVVEFFRTSSVINSKTRDLVYTRHDSQMLRTPLIKLVEISNEEIAEKCKANPNYNPLFMYKEGKVPDDLMLYGYTAPKEIDDRTVRLLFSEFYNGEATYFRNPVKKIDYLCPRSGILGEFALTGSLTLPVKAGVTVDATDIAVSLEIAK